MKRSLVNLTTKEKIIQTTMAMIAEEGIQGITIRKIAARADVNVAAVNYHFGGKDAVINKSLSTVTEKLEQAFLDLNDDSQDDFTNLSRFVNKYCDILFQYPDILKNMVEHAIHNRLLDGQVQYINFLRTEGIDHVKNAIARIEPDKDDQYLSLKTLQLVSSLSYPFLLGETVKEIVGVDYSDQENRQLYNEMVLASIIKRYP